jgi:Holliday junction DNA helicase RuvA
MDYSQVAYGFIDEDERTIFRHLISVSGVGAASARMCLSSYGPSEIVQRISSGDVAALKKVKGIGDKTAQRIIVDLRDKMNKASGIATGSIKLRWLCWALSGIRPKRLWIKRLQEFLQRIYRLKC